MSILIFILFKTYSIAYVAKIICTGNITSLYLGRIKNIENIIKLRTKYKKRHLFSNFPLIQKIKKPGKERIDISKSGKI